MYFNGFDALCLQKNSGYETSLSTEQRYNDYNNMTTRVGKAIKSFPVSGHKSYNIQNTNSEMTANGLDAHCAVPI